MPKFVAFDSSQLRILFPKTLFWCVLNTPLHIFPFIKVTLYFYNKHWEFSLYTCKHKQTHKQVWLWLLCRRPSLKLVAFFPSLHTSPRCECQVSFEEISAHIDGNTKWLCYTYCILSIALGWCLMKIWSSMIERIKASHVLFSLSLTQLERPPATISI